VKIARLVTLVTLLALSFAPRSSAALDCVHALDLEREELVVIDPRRAEPRRLPLPGSPRGVAVRHELADGAGRKYALWVDELEPAFDTGAPITALVYHPGGFLAAGPDTIARLCPQSRTAPEVVRLLRCSLLGQKGGGTNNLTT